MNTLFFQIGIYFISFIIIWWGSGLVVNSVSKLAYGLHLSAFTISFFILGILTSLPEISIGASAIVSGDPAIFVGNLIGGVLVVLLFVIPLLGLTGNGITVPKQMRKSILVGVLAVCFLPTILLRDRVIERWEGIVSIIAYIVLFIFFSKEQGLLESIKHKLKTKRKIQWIDVITIIFGICLLIAGSNQIVQSTVYFADLLRISPFFVSLIIVSLGTNIPEITLVFRSIRQQKTDIAFADYLGSATANTLLLGLLSLIYGKNITVPNHYYHRFIFMFIGLVLVYVFMRSKNKITKSESILLLLLYILFIAIEVFLI